MNTPFNNKPFFKNIRLMSAVFLEVPGEPNQQRPQFATAVSPETVGAVQQVLREATVYNRISDYRIKPAAFAKVDSTILTYAADMAEPREIPGGWENRRVTFILKVSSMTAIGAEVESIVGGYTDGVPKKDGDKLDWDGVTFYVNSINSHRKTWMQTSLGKSALLEVVSSQQVLLEPVWNGLGDPKHEYRTRPSDLFATATRLNLAETLNSELTDVRTLNTASAAMTDRTDVIPAVYLSRVFAAYTQAQDVTMFGMQDGDLLHNARAAVMDSLPRQNPFLAAMSDAKGFATYGVFDMKELKIAFPSINEDAMYYVLGTSAVKEDTKRSCLPPPKLSYANVAMQTIGHATNALMGTMGLSSICFHATNRTENAKPVIAIIDAKSSLAEGVDLTLVLDTFKLRFEQEVLNQVTYNNLMDFTLEVTGELYGITQVDWNGNSEGWHRITIASYADALLSPMVFAGVEKGADQPQLGMANDIMTLLESTPTDDFLNPGKGVWKKED
jgi:hypothetical protein